MLKKTPITQYPKFPTSDWLGGEVTQMLITIEWNSMMVFKVNIVFLRVFKRFELSTVCLFGCVSLLSFLGITKGALKT